ncbi:hypothetical protein AK812_SmicGene41517 [Symbiodinium microadriaticum]|uniref:Uncharacterized protein n=1 Tax=Symbiodinium microadriaticum TaxID=2951 RepID=A0A1Q9C5V9_SYMMI|nr:hypothetical protein AK812_SmicGene41517 [Symbiodinium microadriaticum]
MAYSSWWPSWEADWTTSGSNQDRHWNNTWTPPKSTKGQQDSKTSDAKYPDWNSPTGFKTTHGLPANFVQTKSHLDSREIYGKTMLRKIAPTAWSSKYGLAGQNMEQVKLVDLIWRGWDNQHLRALSHGSYMSMIVCRKVNEAVFLQAVLSLVREKKWDLDDLANHFCKSQSIAEPTKSHPSVEEVKVHQAQALAKFLIEQVEPFATNMSSSSSPAQQEIDSLRAQLEAEKARNSQSAESQQAPKRRRLQEKQTAPLPFVLKEDLVQHAVNPEHLGERVLLNQTLGHTKQSINTWVKRLKQTIGATKHDELTAAIARAPEILKDIPKDRVTLLRDKLSHLGCTVTVATKIRGPEMITPMQRSSSTHYKIFSYMDEIMPLHMDMPFAHKFVWQIYKKTFGDTQVYERLPMQPSQAQEFLLSTCSRSFLQRYKWGINLRTSSLPIAYLLLKQKKDFKGARPSVSYIHFLYAKLFRATAIALDVIMRATCPRSFGLHTLPSILQQLTEFLQMPPDDAHPVVFNQDLVGFFTSIPVFRILNAVRWAVNEYSMLQKTDIDNITFLSTFENKTPSFEYGVVVHDELLNVLYVDNRLVIVSDRILRDHRLKHFLHNNFYQHPVELEHDQNDIVLLPFSVPKFILNDMFGHLTFVLNSYYDYDKTLLQLGTLISECGSSTLRRNYDKFDQTYNTASRKNMQYAAFSKLNLIRFKCSYVIMDNNNRKFLIRFWEPLTNFAVNEPIQVIITQLAIRSPSEIFLANSEAAADIDMQS